MAAASFGPVNELFYVIISSVLYTDPAGGSSFDEVVQRDDFSVKIEMDAFRIIGLTFRWAGSD
jgi:hypothetical protein